MTQVIFCVIFLIDFFFNFIIQYWVGWKLSFIIYFDFLSIEISWSYDQGRGFWHYIPGEIESFFYFLFKSHLHFFFNELSHSYNIDHGFRGLIQLTKGFFFFFLINFFSIFFSIMLSRLRIRHHDLFCFVYFLLCYFGLMTQE